MSATPTAKIGMRAAPDTKARFAALAAARGMTESALLAQLVEHVLAANPSPIAPAAAASGARCSERLTLRLRPGDRARLAARAAARGMRPGTYVAALVHGHLRTHRPLPAAELAQLKAAVGELSAAGRALRALAAPGGPVVAPQAAPEMSAAMAALQGSLDEVRRALVEFIRVNLASWEAGDD